MKYSLSSLAFALRVSALLFFASWGFSANGDVSGTPLSAIAFGSCNRQERPQPLWEVIVANHPQLWIWTGDMIYGDTEDMNVMRSKFDLLKKHPGYHKLCSLCPVIGTWDDHDYGANDAGKEYPKKKESQQVTLDFLNEPKDSPRRSQEGIYASYEYGPVGKRVKVILLDTRYHRDPPGPEGDILGEKQWDWLEKELAASKAQVHLLISSIQLVAEGHRFEKWANFPKARARLLELLEKTHPSKLLVISGDRHWAELSCYVSDRGYRIYDITASGLNQIRVPYPNEPNKWREGETFSGFHFGMLVIDWNASPPTMEIQIRDQENRIQISKKL